MILIFLRLSTVNVPSKVFETSFCYSDAGQTSKNEHNPASIKHLCVKQIQEEREQESGCIE